MSHHSEVVGRERAQRNPPEVRLLRSRLLSPSDDSSSTTTDNGAPPARPCVLRVRRTTPSTRSRLRSSPSPFAAAARLRVRGETRCWCSVEGYGWDWGGGVAGARSNEKVEREGCDGAGEEEDVPAFVVRARRSRRGGGRTGEDAGDDAEVDAVGPGAVRVAKVRIGTR